MYIEIRKVAFVNKGAELMLRAALKRVSTEYPCAKFVMEPRNNAPFEQRAKLCMYQKVFPGRYGLLPLTSLVTSMIPSYVKKSYGIVTNQEIDVVLDASGFSYTDQIPSLSTYTLAKLSQIWKKQGTKLILLPQAFGPFISPKTIKYAEQFINNADLIFARDMTSYKHLIDVAGERSNIRVAPDFTNLLDGVIPDDFNQEQCRFCIVPNYRMLEKTSSDDAKAYIPFLADCVNYLLKRDAKPFILIHETERDKKIANELTQFVAGELPVIQEQDPLKIKGILGACDATLGSRFHGLVSALSQGVPSIGTGWSHKYIALFEEYDFKEGLVTFQKTDYMRILEILSEETSRKKITNRLKKKSHNLKLASEQMWLEVFKTIGTR